ncbi:MAG TPA: porin [Candidatus Aquabacterium excrementipullorum]|nr:porin [Candidatus Aquabacterium excrementipullorum]
MKKTVLALATLAAVSGSAFAQSSVTIYGVVDASLEHLKGDDSVTRVSSDAFNSSRLGFRGVEDLGGGLKAKFNLESAIAVDTGGVGTGSFWSRAAWVGLEGGFGELRIGRQDSLIGGLAGNTSILGAQPYDDLNIAGTFSGSSSEYRRVNNGITYFLPKFVDGLTLAAQYSTAAKADEVANNDTGKTWGLNAQYVAGPFGIGAAYINSKADNLGNKDIGWLAFASYDFGVLKLTGYYEQDDREALSAATTYDKRDVYGLKVGVPIGSDFNLSAGVSKANNVAFNNNRDATFVTIKGVYTLSKRTALYALVTNVANDSNVDTTGGLNVGSAQAPVGQDSTGRGIAIGVRHAF